MTEPGDLGYEQPEADVLDQRREEGQADEPALEPFGDVPVEADEADLMDQHRVVPAYDEDA